MNTITAIDGTLIPTDKILEIRQQVDIFVVSTQLRSYKVSAQEVMGLRKPPRTTRKVSK